MSERDGSSEPLVGVLEALKQIMLRQELEDQAAQRERFISLLAHDLRTPLTVIRSSAELARQLELSAAPEFDTITRTIIKMVDRADAMIRDLLDIERLHAGEKIPLNFEHCDLREIIKAAIQELGIVHGARFQLHEGGAIHGRWSKDGMRRVIENLAANAIKYGERGTPISIMLVMKKGRVALAVHNKGKPITRENRVRLFQVFKQGQQQSSAVNGAGGPSPGWGLGLALVRAIIETHGGRIRVRSNGGGTTFLAILPEC